MRLSDILKKISIKSKNVNSLDKDISLLEKKKAEIDKRCAEFQTKINSAQRSIIPRTSASMAANKMRKITNWQSDYARKMSESADIGKKIADKRTKRNDAYIKLQKEQQLKQSKALKQMKQSYEKRINEFNDHMTQDIITNRDNINGENEEDYDVFVSHAWENKEDFADEFVQSLCDYGIKVWYDTTQMKWGDSMRAKIDSGLKKSKFGVVVLSPDYIKEGKYWTKTELDGLFQMESINGKTLLPIWHNLTKKEVMAYSPTIASKLAMTSVNMTPQEIAGELKKLLA